MMMNVNWESESVTELGIRGTAGEMSEAGGVAHRWFYSILLQPHRPPSRRRRLNEEGTRFTD
jgi:hypothetical protein